MRLFRVANSDSVVEAPTVLEPGTTKNSMQRSQGLGLLAVVPSTVDPGHAGEARLINSPGTFTR